MNTFNKIILIDDNEVTNFYNRDILEDLGYTNDITVFTDAEKALDFFENEDDNLSQQQVLTLIDVKMPQMTGFELLSEMEELELSILDTGQFCMLTSSDLVKDREEFEKFPFVSHFLVKPLTAEVLEEAVASLVKV